MSSTHLSAERDVYRLEELSNSSRSSSSSNEEDPLSRQLAESISRILFGQEKGPYPMPVEERKVLSLESKQISSLGQTELGNVDVLELLDKLKTLRQLNFSVEIEGMNQQLGQLKQLQQLNIELEKNIRQPK